MSEYSSLVFALGDISKAEKGAKEGNREKVHAALKGVGNWTLNLANNIGTKLAADAIKNSINIQR
jgi:hypothetical protein